MDIEVLVVGGSGSGKSAIAQVIYDALAASGLKVELNDNNGIGVVDEKPGVIKETLSGRLESIVGRDTKVCIKSINARK